jgi:cytochrome P450
VIKEVLRLWPPASGVRLGRADYFIKDPITGQPLPTENMNMWTLPIAMGRSKKLWGPDAAEFKPERFLGSNSADVHPHAWRPFEKGPRNCIGQELALIEMKVVLAMTVREFEIRTAYEELGSLMQDGSLWAKDDSFRKGPQKVFGEEMYQILLAAAKPREGMPARIRRVSEMA